MRFSPSPHIDRSCLIESEGLHQIANGERVIPCALLTPEAEDLRSRKPLHVGCSGECYQGRRCTCSHSRAWASAPRHPRTRRRSRTHRIIRDLVRWLLNPRAW